MLAISSFSYLLLQGPGVYYSGGTQEEVAKEQSKWALAGLIVCTALFVAYIVKQLRSTGSKDATDDLRNKVIIDAILKGEISLLGVMTAELQGFVSATPFQQQGMRPFHKTSSSVSSAFGSSGSSEIENESLLGESRDILDLEGGRGTGGTEGTHHEHHEGHPPHRHQPFHLHPNYNEKTSLVLSEWKELKHKLHVSRFYNNYHIVCLLIPFYV